MVHDSEILKNLVIKNRLVHNMEKRIMDSLEKLYYSEKDFYELLLEALPYEQNTNLQPPFHPPDWSNELCSCNSGALGVD